MTPTTVSDNFQLNAAKNLDYWQGKDAAPWRPYASRTEALASVPGTYRYVSQMLPIKNGGNIELWYFSGGTTDANLTFMTNVVDTNSVFNDTLTTPPTVKVPIFSDGSNSVIVGLINNWTGELESYKKTAVKPNTGNAITAADVLIGRGIYRKLNSDFYMKQFDGPVDARWFGLQTNTTGCEVAINDAIQAASAIEAELFIPAGFYSINSPIKLVSNCRITGESNLGPGEPKCSTATGTVITQLRSPEFNPVTGNGKINIRISNLHFYRCRDLNISNANNLKLLNVTVSNSIHHGIFINGGTNIVIDGCKVFNCLQKDSVGIIVEANSYPVNGVSITNCLVDTTYDNGIAVRSISNYVLNSNVSFNRIFNAGKAGIKNTIEASSNTLYAFHNATIIGNYIEGWGRNVIENAIDPSCYLDSTSFIENITIEGNIMVSMSANTLQNSYIGISRGKRISVVGNICRNGCNTTGIFLYKSFDCMITGNYVEKACQSATSSGVDDGGIEVQDGSNNVISNNIVKNTGILTTQRPGISIFGSQYGSYSGNIIYDDQPSPTQSHGILEVNDSSFLALNNLYTANITYGNINPNKISAKSKVYHAAPVTATDTNYALTDATSLLILPPLTVANRTLNLYDPRYTSGSEIDKVFNATLTIFNSNSSS